MSRASVSQSRQQQFGWDTSSHDYHESPSRMSRTPTVVPEVPHYPNVHMLFKNKVTYEDEQEVPREPPQLQKMKPTSSKPGKKVQVTDQREFIGEDKMIVEESVDTEADSFIQKRHKGFELHRWKTFTM